MEMNSLLIGLIPLIGFAVVFRKFSLQSGIWTGIGLAFLELGFFYFFYGIFDWTILAAAMLMLVFGIMSIRYNTEKFIKLQPAFLFFLFSGIFAYHHLQGHSFLVDYFRKYQSVISPQLLMQLKAQNFERLLVVFSYDFIWVFLIAGLIMLYAGLKMSIKWWLFLRAVLIYILLFANVFFRQIYG